MSNIIDFSKAKSKLTRQNSVPLMAMTTRSVMCSYVSDQPYFYMDDLDIIEDEDDLDMTTEEIRTIQELIRHDYD